MIKQILDDYIPESKEVDIEDLRISNNFYIKRFPDAIYFGECVRNDKGKLIRSGKGIMKYKNDRVYEGEWETD
jgi:hypothetical protein